ncbi:metal ABC transporter permease [Bartonella sp. HY038]|uniref:metal ABC transporter permease n=1 Tax=Bartonella sp. HY038 TaxID=2759660 RepID=UPI002738387D|nr:metal ABC transporter permease [Bartonella sp. HY038]
MIMLDILLEPFQFDFMVKGLLITVIVSIPMAFLSCFLVLKGWALLGDALSHAVFPGVVIAYMVGLPFAVGAFSAGILTAMVTGFLQANSRVKQDTILGIVFSGMFALGLVLVTTIESDVHLTHILFGSLLGVSWNDVLSTLGISVFITVILSIKWRDFQLFIFDPIEAKAVGLTLWVLHYGLLIMISLAIVAALKSVGIILSISLLIAPGAIAFLLTRKLSHMVLIAVSLGVVVSFCGIYASFFFDSSPAATIVFFETAIFILVFIWQSLKNRRNTLIEE